MSWSLGVVPALSAIVKVFSHTGDKILIQTPVYSEFYDVTEAWGRVVVENQLIEKMKNGMLILRSLKKKQKSVRFFFCVIPTIPLALYGSRRN